MTIAHDATSVSTPAANFTTHAWNHTIGSGSNRALLVAIGWESQSTVTVSTCTFNGVAMTLGRGQAENSEGNKARVEIWYMLEADLPAAGTYEVSVTLSGAITSGQGSGSGTSLTGVDQAAPEAATGSNTATDGTTHSTNIVTVTDNAWVFEAIIGGNASTWSPNNSQTERSDTQQGGANSSMATATLAVASAGSTACGWTASATQNRFAHALISVAEETVVTITGAGALVGGSGVLAGAGALTISGSGTLAGGAGTVAGAGTETIAGAAALTGPVGTLAGVGTETIPGAAALVGGSGVLAGAGTETIAGAGALTGTAGVLAGAGTALVPDAPGSIVGVFAPTGQTTGTFTPTGTTTGVFGP